MITVSSANHFLPGKSAAAKVDSFRVEGAFLVLKIDCAEYFYNSDGREVMRVELPDVSPRKSFWQRLKAAWRILWIA